LHTYDRYEREPPREIHLKYLLNAYNPNNFFSSSLFAQKRHSKIIIIILCFYNFFLQSHPISFKIPWKLRKEVKEKKITFMIFVTHFWLRLLFLLLYINIYFFHIYLIFYFISHFIYLLQFDRLLLFGLYLFAQFLFFFFLFVSNTRIKK
jgi:hypothetical protein